MKLQDYIIDVTKKAAEEAFKYAAAVPADKADWQPLELGRSVLDQTREMAKCPVWAHALVSNQPMPEFNEEAVAAMKAEMEQWKTVEACRVECMAQLEKLSELYKNLPDERLAETKWLPYDGGRDFTMPEMMEYPRWNFNYHLGQIAYIQTLYGDKEMH